MVGGPWDVAPPVTKTGSSARPPAKDTSRTWCFDKLFPQPRPLGSIRPPFYFRPAALGSPKIWSFAGFVFFFPGNRLIAELRRGPLLFPPFAGVARPPVFFFGQGESLRNVFFRNSRTVEPLEKKRSVGVLGPPPGCSLPLPTGANLPFQPPSPPVWFPGKYAGRHGPPTPLSPGPPGSGPSSFSALNKRGFELSGFPLPEPQTAPLPKKTSAKKRCPLSSEQTPPPTRKRIPRPPCFRA